MKTKKPNADDARKFILELLLRSKDAKVRVRSGDVVEETGVPHSSTSSAMKTLFREGDQILELPKGRPLKKGATFLQQTGGQNHAGGNLVIQYARKTERS